MSQDSSTAETAYRPPDPLTNADALPPAQSTSSLKRRVSQSSFTCPGDSISRKRMKEASPEGDDKATGTESGAPDASANFVEVLAEELQCGCCSELVYNPLLVMPCQHFFCGSCVVLWVRHGGTSCPACRGLATVAMPFRALQTVIDSLLRAAPHKARTERERQQADEVYKSGHSIRIPPPREASPPPDMDRSTEYVHPCPHCVANNPYDWRCPQPIPDPASDLEHAWHVDDGTPPGHGHCGNCENLLATRAPTTTRCDLCLVSFCGIGVQERCNALPIMSQHPHNLATHTDLIQSAEVYDCFDGNTVETEIMLEYVEAQGLSPRHIYREIVQHIQKQPRGFQALIDLDLFSDIHAVAPSAENNPEAARNRICRPCAAEVFLWGLRDWWIRERQKGFVEGSVMNRKDCPEGSSCILQKDDIAHAQEFNHIFAPREPEEPVTAAAPVPVVEAPVVDPAPAVPPRIPTPAPASSAVTPAASHPLPLPLAASSSATSLSFLLNVDEDVAMPSPPEFRPPTPDMIVDTLQL
ncbi:hypothetical protein NLJ89_g9681 [Agrocybe chaxingu]|uniref:RING-type domain-containing protein n=1 Tax=Agrocybe chaxingu TaxID=84603 RepID=A0A9W8K036_9AGAR|nr:hypothetical protein NLJ89_g9681 [Agrocybe chaxingu]